MSDEAQNPQQSTPGNADDLALDKESLKDLEPRNEEQDQVRGGFGATVQICVVKPSGLSGMVC
jgi:hypothetical protein